MTNRGTPPLAIRLAAVRRRSWPRMSTRSRPVVDSFASVMMFARVLWARAPRRPTCSPRRRSSTSRRTMLAPRRRRKPNWSTRLFGVGQHAIARPLLEPLDHSRGRVRIDERPIEGHREQSRNHGLYAVHADGHAVRDQSIKQFVDVSTRDVAKRQRTPTRQQVLVGLCHIVSPRLLAALRERLVQLCQIGEREHGRDIIPRRRRGIGMLDGRRINTLDVECMPLVKGEITRSGEADGRVRAHVSHLGRPCARYTNVHALTPVGETRSARPRACRSK
jgi:hypothetical protein